MHWVIGSNRDALCKCVAGINYMADIACITKQLRSPSAKLARYRANVCDDGPLSRQLWTNAGWNTRTPPSLMMIILLDITLICHQASRDSSAVLAARQKNTPCSVIFRLLRVVRACRRIIVLKWFSALSQANRTYVIRIWVCHRLIVHSWYTGVSQASHTFVIYGCVAD